MLPVGALVAGRYRILGVVGAGGMGVVYHAQDEQLETPVALKVMNTGRRLDAAALERFRDEIRLARKVSHPSVVRIHDIGNDADLVFLTMDYVDGQTLRERLADGPLPPPQAVSIARQLAEGLTAAHECGVVHRDLKPDNVMVADDGRAWLTDFGIARSIGSERLTRSGAVLGTPDYLSPEQVRGGEIDGRADIYALGLVLFEMLSNEVPLRGDTIEETASRRAAGRTADMAALKGVPAGIRRIVARCLEPNPDERYPNAAELAADLLRGGADLRVRKAFKWAGAAAVVLLIAAASYQLFTSSRIHAPASEESITETRRVAVLPLRNNTGLGDYNWIRTGLSESLANSLAESPDLQVVESLRVFQTLEALGVSDGALSAEDLRQVAALLDVSYLVGGALVGDARETRLELTLRRSPDGREQQVFAPVAAAGLLSAADASVMQLRRLLRIREIKSAGAAPTLSENVAAMTAYDEGIALLVRGDSVQAIGPLENSRKEDATFGLAWSALARAYADAGRWEDAIDASEKSITLFDKQNGRAELQARAQHAVLSGEPERGVELLEELVERYPNDVAARTQLAEQLGELGRFNEAQTLLQKIVETDPNHPRAWFLRGKFSAISGDPKTAVEDYYVRALVIQNRLGSAQGRGEVFNAIGIAHEQLGDLDIARQYYRNAVEMRTVANDRRGVAGSLANIARLDVIQGDFSGAREALTKSQDIRKEIGDMAGAAGILNEFGVLEEEAGDYAAALQRYREALRIRRDLGDDLGLAESYTNLAFTYLVLGDYDNASAFSRSAFEKFDEADSQRGRMAVREIDGELGIARGNWDTALKAFVANLAASRQADNPFSEAVAEGGLGRVAQYQGKPKAAFEAWDRALAILKPLSDSRGIVEYELRKIELLLTLETVSEAAAALEDAAPFLADGGSIAQRAEFQRLKGITAAMQGDSDEAAISLDEARELAGRSGSDALVLRMDIARLRALGGGGSTKPEEIAEKAERLGNAPMRLEAMELIAASKLAAGDFTAAYETAHNALRAPIGVDPWIGNWKLSFIAAEAAAKTDPERASSLRETASAQLQALIDATPEDRRQGLIARQESDMLNVARN